MNLNRGETISKWSPKAGLAFLYAGTAALCYRLYLRQAIQFPGALGTYRSDLLPHIEEGLAGTGYSLMEFLYGFLLGKLHWNEKAIAVILMLITIGTVYLGYRLMCRIARDTPKDLLHLFSFFCIFVFAIYIKALNPHRYLGMQHGSAWHNDTYTAMRFAGMLVLLFYFKFQRTYFTEYHLREMLVFTVLLTVTNMIKPNFIFAFGPVMALYLLCDMIRTKGKTFWMQVFFGVPVLISLGIVYFQVTRLFADPEMSVSSGPMFGFSFAYTLRLRAQTPVASLLQSIAFPLFIILFHLRRLKTDRFVATSWLTWLFGLCEYLFIHEEGYRKDHGNLAWGYSFCIYLVFLVSSACYLEDLAAFFRERRGTMDREECAAAEGRRALAVKSTAGRVIYLSVATVLFALHLVSGITYFIHAFQGGSIWI